MLVSGAKTGDNEPLKITSVALEKQNVLLNSFTSFQKKLHCLKILDSGNSLLFPLLPALRILELIMHRPLRCPVTFLFKPWNH